MGKPVRDFILAPRVPVTPRPIGSALTFHAQRDPDRPALTCDGVSVTRTELERAANRRARMLQGLGVGAGDFVAISLPNGHEFVETTFAVWKLGATPVPLSPRLPTAELQALVDLLNPRLLIDSNEGQVTGHTRLAGGSTPSGDISYRPLPEVAPKHLKAIASGGSTGRPKIIVDALPGLIDPEVSILGLEINDTVLAAGPLYHAAPFGSTFLALSWGAHVVLMPRFDAERALALIDRHQVRYAYFVPTMLHRMWRAIEQGAPFDGGSMEIIMHNGSTCPVWLKENWIERLGPDRVWEVYGGTEMIGTTTISGRDWLEHKGSVGRLTTGGGLKVFNDAGEECAPREVGLIYFLTGQGSDASYKYVGAEANRRGAWESLGDLGYLDEDGYLFLSDRRTDMIVSGGANVYPAEVEAALDSHPSVLSSVVVGLPDQDLGHRIHAIVQLETSAGSTVDGEALARYLSDRLVRYKIPRTFEFVDIPLRDDAGKARRTALRAARIDGVAS